MVVGEGETSPQQEKKQPLGEISGARNKGNEGRVFVSSKEFNSLVQLKKNKDSNVVALRHVQERLAIVRASANNILKSKQTRKIELEKIQKELGSVRERVNKLAAETVGDKLIQSRRQFHETKNKLELLDQHVECCKMELAVEI